jgi:large subunit ribosomal protein L13
VVIAVGTGDKSATREVTTAFDAGDFVHVTNARAVHFTGQKLTGKRYHWFSGYPGGLRTTTLQARRVQDPTGIIRDAVFGMLPRNRQRARMLRRLTISP